MDPNHAFKPTDVRERVVSFCRKVPDPIDGVCGYRGGAKQFVQTDAASRPGLIQVSGPTCHMY